MNKFYEFKNKVTNLNNISADLYIYGEIVDEKWYDSEISLADFKKELDELGEVNNLNIYFNSPGGSVFVASTMVSMLQRLKDKGTTINAYVDGLSASASSFLMMVADKVHMYKNSMVMIHKPMSLAFGNALELQKTVDSLNKIEDSVMIPLYMSKAKVDEKKIRSLIEAETWFGAEDIGDIFDIDVLETDTQMVACISEDLFKKYKNVPDKFRNTLNCDEEVSNSEEKAEEIQDNEPENTEETTEKEPIIEENIVENAEKEAENCEKFEEIKAKIIKNKIYLRKREINNE